MSGISGFTNLSKKTKEEQSAIIKKMIESIKHRGPDGEDYYIEENISMGQAQLADNKLMKRKIGDEEYIIIFNGEIYNAPKLKIELEELGHNFQTSSNTEILLNAYLEWKENSLSHLTGMFAFAIWESRSKKLFAARDRMGAKPFFFTRINNDFAFASEIKAILTIPNFKAQIDKNGLAEILTLLPSRTEGFGIFKGIEELPSSHFLTWQNGALNIKKYWEFESKPHNDDLQTTAEKVSFLLKQAVESQMTSSVATLLSGGLDSSAITAIISSEYQKNNQTLPTYSFEFEDNDKYFKSSNFQPDSDSIWTKKVSDALKTNHTILIANTNDLIDNLKKAMLARDLPGMADIDSSLLYYCNLIKKEKNICLSGEAADEVFMGYPWFRSQKAFETNQFPWCYGTEDRLKLFNSDIVHYSNAENYQQEKYFESIAKTPKLEGESKEEARRRELFYICLHWFGASLLERKDRMSMASGLEVRMPFTDHKLAQYVWNIPWDMKYYNEREKGILRFALKGILPDDVTWRRKSPYPKTHNPSYYEAVKKALIEVLGDSSNKITPLINKKAIENMLTLGNETSTPFFGQLMSTPQICGFLLQLNFWLEHYKVSII